MAAERLQHAHCRPVLRCDVSHAAEMLLEGVLCPCDGGEQVGDECEVARVTVMLVRATVTNCL